MAKGRRFVAASLVALFAAGLTIGTAAQEAGKRIVELSLSMGEVSGDVETAGGLGVVRVTQGEDVELHWTTDEPTELHLHGYNVEAELTAECETVMPFKARFGGRFALEAHTHGGGDKTILFIEVRPK